VCIVAMLPYIPIIGILIVISKT